MQPERRRQLLRRNLEAALASPGRGWSLLIEVEGLSGANVELSRPAKGPRLVVGQGFRDYVRREVLPSAVPWLTKNGFSGGGRKGNYRTWSVPVDPGALARLMDEALTKGFAAPDDYSPRISSSLPGLPVA
jgi:hypothetical protein